MHGTPERRWAMRQNMYTGTGVGFSSTAMAPHGSTWTSSCTSCQVASLMWIAPGPPGAGAGWRGRSCPPRPYRSAVDQPHHLLGQGEQRLHQVVYSFGPQAYHQALGLSQLTAEHRDWLMLAFRSTGSCGVYQPRRRWAGMGAPYRRRLRLEVQGEGGRRG
jgi:hypothetical protein